MSGVDTSKVRRVSRASAERIRVVFGSSRLRRLDGMRPAGVMAVGGVAHLPVFDLVKLDSGGWKLRGRDGGDADVPFDPPFLPGFRSPRSCGALAAKS